MLQIVGDVNNSKESKAVTVPSSFDLGSALAVSRSAADVRAAQLDKIRGENRCKARQKRDDDVGEAKLLIDPPVRGVVLSDQPMIGPFALAPQAAASPSSAQSGQMARSLSQRVSLQTERMSAFHVPTSRSGPVGPSCKTSVAPLTTVSAEEMARRESVWQSVCIVSCSMREK